MKNLIKLIILFAISSNATAQVTFEQGTWNDIKAKAKAENKIIFVDANTSWCGPCKWMAKNTFMNDTVAGFFNSNFINVMIDMEKGEGIDIAKQYEVNFYPTLLFINSDGEIIHRQAGALPPAPFVQLGKDALNPDTQFRTLVQKYQSGTREAVFIKSYLDALAQAGLDTKKIFNEYFASIKQSEYAKRENWNIIYQYLGDTKSDAFKYLSKNTDSFVKEFTVDTVTRKIYSVYLRACGVAIYQKDADSTKYVEYFKLRGEIQKSSFVQKEKLLLESSILYCTKVKDYDNYAKDEVLFIEKYHLHNADTITLATNLNSVAYTFYENVKDAKMLAKAEAWAKRACEIIPNDPAIMDTYACLLSAAGKKKEAIKIEKRVIEILKADPENNQDFIADSEKNIAAWGK